MRRLRREAVFPVALSIGAYALAFAQRPGWASADTKINLHVAPGRFLLDVASMWTSSGQLGDVQTGQYSGYLFPMGPFFAAGHAIGLPAWVVQRLWLGTLLALGAWGTVRLVDSLLGRPRGVAQLVAGAVTILNPFVVTYVNRSTVTLLAYVALPWLLLAVHEGLSDARPGTGWLGWRWPAAFALLVAASGGGINGAVTAWMLLGPVLLLLYELLFTPVSTRQARAFLLRVAPLTVLASVWWLIPTYIQSSYGIDFLHFTEQPGTVWGTTSITESLRLMSFWLSYVGVGFAGRAIPYFDDSHVLLFSTPVVVASLLLPALALAGFVWTRRWRYGPFFLLLAIVALLVMGAGFPDGTPLRHGLTFTYNHVAAVRFLRASYKAAPLLAIALACLAGAAAAEGWQRLSAARNATRWRLGASIVAAAVLALAAWPLVTGRAQDAQVSFKRVPSAWRAAAASLDRELPTNSRAMVLPGDLFSFYTWGGTIDPILPALSRRPVAERTEVPYADLRATDLLWTIDGLVHQERLLPGQLAPLLRLIGVRAAVTATDNDLARSDAPPPADVAAELRAQPGFATAARSYGPLTTFVPTGLGPAQRLPQVRRYDLSAARGLVRLEPMTAPTVVDGSAGALAGLAAFGELPDRGTLLYSADLAASRLRELAANGADFVISDSNRRRAFVDSSLEQNVGPTLTAAQDVSADGIILDPFRQGSAYQTVATFTGIRSVDAPASPERRQFPEHAAFAAIDGSPETSWVADPTLDAGRHWLQVDFDRPLDVPYVDLLPYDDIGGSVRVVQIAGHTFAIHPGWNRLRLDMSSVLSLRVALTSVSAPASGASAGAGGIRELRIPGVTATEQLRLPIDAAQALSGQDLRRSALTYLFERTTGDGPFRRDLALAQGPASQLNVKNAGDAEQTMRRVFGVPATRGFRAAAWVQTGAQTADDVLDRLAGYRGPVMATSSSRFDGTPQWRASRVFDGSTRTAWIGDYVPGGSTWVQWRASSPTAIERLRLIGPTEPVRRPTLVRIVWPGGSTAALPVGAGGEVVLGRVARARTFRIEILRASAPPGATAADQRAVGIAEVRGVSGLPTVPTSRRHTIAAPCGTVRVQLGVAAVPFMVTGSAAAFEQGTPLLARSCGAAIELAAGTQRLVVQPGPFAVDELRLYSAAPVSTTSAAGASRVLAAGTTGRGSYDHVRVEVSRPSWLVLGEGYNRGWRAWCDGHSLGAQIPVDGYANGWRVGPGCRQVRFAFAPNRLAVVGFVVSGIAAIACLMLLAGAVWLARRRVAGRVPPSAAPPPQCPYPLPATYPEPGWPPHRALVAALLVGAAFGFVFGIRQGVISIPVTTLILWRGIGARTLALVAGALLGLVVPFLYVVQQGDESGGNHFTYAVQHIDAHWVGVAAVGLLTAALWRTLWSRLRR
jgi:arabinofuranan 3-O-arabinosyltransferase